jgi:hypothetical protein
LRRSRRRYRLRPLICRAPETITTACRRPPSVLRCPLWPNFGLGRAASAVVPDQYLGRGRRLVARRCHPVYQNTEYAALRLEWKQEGWLAFRDNCVLMRNGQRAIFSSSEEARRVADAHYREGYPNSDFIFDGFAWFPDPDPWWSYPGRVLALRGNLAA